MKNTVLSFVLIGIAIALSAQNNPIDFEESGNGANWTWTTFENDVNPALEIVDNPSQSDPNTSTRVAKFTALQDGEPFAGCESMHGTDIGTFTLSPGASTIKLMVWKSVISDVGIKLVDASSWSMGEIKVSNTVTGQWEELTFDFSSNEGIPFDQIVIFPDFDERDGDNIIYFDNIVFGESVTFDAPLVAAPVPQEAEENVIALFSEVYALVPVNDWLTAWSSAGLEDIQIEGDDTKKYSSLDFAGIETVNENLIDASEMEYFHMDVWTPNVNTFRIKLVDFGADAVFDGGDDSEHEIVFLDHAIGEWVSYDIPLPEFTSLNSKEHIAQYIISSADPIGTGIVYIDNVYFSKIPFGISELSEEEIIVFPNPAQSVLYLKNVEQIERVVILDMTGRIVVDYLDRVDFTSIDVEQLEKGSYIIQVEVNGVLLSQTFIKY